MNFTPAACPLLLVVLNSSRRLSVMAVIAGLLSETCMELVFQKLPHFLPNMLIFW